MDLFEFEIEQPEPQLYSCSMASTESLPELNEAQTPLLYESRISSRNNSVAINDDLLFDECFIDQLDISQDVLPSVPKKMNGTPTTTYKTSPSIFTSLEQSSAIDETITKGTMTLKNNYKKWLLSTSTS